MPVPTTPSSVAVLNQQQQEVIYYLNQPGPLSVSLSQNTTGLQTAVENGRVVVKPIAPVPVEPE